jgi:hypothetical protein
VNGSVPPFTFATVPSTPPCLPWFVFGDAVLVVVPWTPPLDCVVPATPALLVGVLEELTLVFVEELTLVFDDELTLVFDDELTLVFDDEFPWTDADGPAVTVVAHACAPPLNAWTSGACVEPGQATLCGWLLPGPKIVAPACTPFDAATCAAVLPLPYCFDESAFAEACTVAAAVAVPLPDAVHVVELSYVHLVALFVLFAGFIPGVVADAFVPALAEPDTWAWFCVCADAAADCFSCPGAVAELPWSEPDSAADPETDAFTSTLAEPETCAWPCAWTVADVVAAAFSWPGAFAEFP